MWVQSLGQEESLEEGTVIHSSNLSWKTPQTVEHGGLQSMGSQLKQLSTHTCQDSVAIQLNQNIRIKAD